MDLEQKLRNLIAEALQAGSADAHKLFDWLCGLQKAKLEVNLISSKIEGDLAHLVAVVLPTPPPVDPPVAPAPSPEVAVQS